MPERIYKYILVSFFFFIFHLIFFTSTFCSETKTMAPTAISAPSPGSPSPPNLLLSVVKRIQPPVPEKKQPPFFLPCANDNDWAAYSLKSKHVPSPFVLPPLAPLRTPPPPNPLAVAVAYGGLVGFAAIDGDLVQGNVP